MVNDTNGMGTLGERLWRVELAVRTHQGPCSCKSRVEQMHRRECRSGAMQDRSGLATILPQETMIIHHLAKPVAQKAVSPSGELI